MKITVDTDRCQGHNRCHTLAPDLFDIDDLGYATASAAGDLSPGDEPTRISPPRRTAPNTPSDSTTEPGATMNRPPVTDWATDFDHLDSEFVKDPHTIYSRLRDECPVAHTDRYHGVWIPTRYEDLAAIAHDHQRFSSRTILVTDRAESPTDLGFHAPPITEDPPYHTDIRRLLLPVFSPAVVAAYEPITETMANDLIDGFIERGECDAAADYAQHVPIKVITRMLGIPDSDHARFRDWIHRLIEESPLAEETTFDAIFEIGGYLAGHVEDHRATPRRHHHPPPRRPHA